MLGYLQNAWTKAQPSLRDRVGAAVFDAWIVSLRPLALERGVVHVEAPTRMAREHIGRLYAGEIADVLSAEIGTRVTVQVETAPDAFSPDGIDVGPAQPIVDASNRTAYLALQSLIEGKDLPSKLFLFHGPPGAGKSFLLRWWRDTNKSKIAHFNATDLIKAFQASLQEHRVAGFRAELARPIPLLIDEVHRISGHRRLQLELSRVLEERRGLREPTLLASRWHPGEIWRLEPSFETWLLSGFVARIDEPSPSARLAFLRALEGKPSQNGRAANVEDLARSVRGGYHALRQAWSEDRDRVGGRARYWKLIDPRPTFDRICKRVADACDVEVEEVVGQTQRRRVSSARKILSWLCVQEGLSRAEVGRYLGGRTRAAISYAIKSLEREMADDAELKRRVEGMQ